MSDHYADFINDAWARTLANLPPIDERLLKMHPAVMAAFVARVQRAMERNDVAEVVTVLDDWKRELERSAP
jgi:hypothetical protein